MVEEINFGARNVRVVDAIVVGIEETRFGDCLLVSLMRVGREPPAFRTADSDPMQQRIDAGSGNIGVGLQIDDGIERRRRPAILPPPLLDIVVEWIQVGQLNIRVAGTIIFGIEKARFEDFPLVRLVGIWSDLPIIHRPGSDPVQQRRDAGSGDVRVRFQIGDGIELRRWPAAFAPALPGIVLERIHPRADDIRVALAIVFGIEKTRFEYGSLVRIERATPQCSCHTPGPMHITRFI